MEKEGEKGTQKILGPDCEEPCVPVWGAWTWSVEIGWKQIQICLGSGT